MRTPREWIVLTPRRRVIWATAGLYKDRIVALWCCCDPVPIELLLGWLCASLGAWFLWFGGDLLHTTHAWDGLIAVSELLHVPGQHAWGWVFFAEGCFRLVAVIGGVRRWRRRAAFVGMMLWMFLFFCFLLSGWRWIAVPWNFGLASCAGWVYLRIVAPGEEHG